MAIHVVREMLDTVGRMAYAGRRLLLGQSTTDPKAGVAIQVDEADGALHTKTVAGSVCAVTGAVTTSGTVTEASAADIKSAVQILDDIVGTDRTDAVTEIAAVGGKATDATSLPADTVAGRIVQFLTDLKGVLLTRNAYLAAGEDLALDVQKVEHRYAYATGTAQAQVKATAGLLHSFRCNCTTAGTITIWDNPAEAGTAIDAIPMAIGECFTHRYDVSAGAGLYIGFDATWAGSWCASYR